MEKKISRCKELKVSKKKLAQKLGVSRSSLYYKSKKKEADEVLKKDVLSLLQSNPCYGHRRVARALNLNKKRISRLMKKYGIKPFIRRGKKPWKPDDLQQQPVSYTNTGYKLCPLYPNVLWAGDFTYIKFKDQFIYLATVIDVRTREIIGTAASFHHSQNLVRAALTDAVKNRRCYPKYFHSDQGSEYKSESHADHLIKQGVTVSMSRKGSPWQNGFQESFYSQFKLELGRVNRFNSVGELMEAIYQRIHYYNNTRIHTKLNMSPRQFFKLLQDRKH